jgi:hypothetical protein
MGLWEMCVCVCVDWMRLFQDGEKWWARVRKYLELDSDRGNWIENFSSVSEY